MKLETDADKLGMHSTIKSSNYQLKPVYVETTVCISNQVVEALILSSSQFD
jgi:hypothetical protein